MMFYGPPGIGKTFFVNSLSERVLFLSTDRGTRSQAALRLEIDSIDRLDQVVQKLEATRPCPYDIIALDHVDDFTHLINDEVCTKLGIDSLGDAGYGKGWKLSSDSFYSLIGRIKALKTGLIFICHETIKTVKVSGLEKDRIMPDLSKSSWKILVPLVDLVGFCGWTPVKNAEGKRVEIRTLTTVPREDLYAKDRTRRVRPPGIEKLDGKKFMESFIVGDKK